MAAFKKKEDIKSSSDALKKFEKFVRGQGWSAKEAV